jgi:hypothetical protein
MAYEKINWQNFESGGTPLSADNLNKMDEEIYRLSNEFGDIDTALDEIIKIQEELIGGDS